MLDWWNYHWNTTSLFDLSLISGHNIGSQHIDKSIPNFHVGDLFVLMVLSSFMAGLWLS